MLGHFMFLYMFPLIGVFVAAFLIPTKRGMTYTALAMAAVPQILALVYLLLGISKSCCGCIKKQDFDNGGCLWATYDNILQPRRFFEFLENYMVTPAT